MTDDTLFDEDTELVGNRKTRRKTKRDAGRHRHGPTPKLTPEQQIEADRLATRDQDAKRVLIAETLRLAVPMWIEKANTWDPGRERLAVLGRWADDAVGPLAFRGDDLMFGDGRPGEAAEIFNHLARGVAALSFQPGGVRVFGMVWCHEHSPAGVESADQLCGRCT